MSTFLNVENETRVHRCDPSFNSNFCLLACRGERLPAHSQYPAFLFCNSEKDQEVIAYSLSFAKMCTS